jgi:L-lactate dehydrogenase
MRWFPPDPLADMTRELANHDRVLSTGTCLDSLRFRVHLAAHLGVSPASIEAMVLGEHGTSQVYLWSASRIAGTPVLDVLARGDLPLETVCHSIECEAHCANIAIIEGNGARQYGIGMVSARIAEIVLRDERTVIPVGSYIPEYGVTLSLPTIVGRRGVVRILQPIMFLEERHGLLRSAEALKSSRAQAGLAMRPRQSKARQGRD